MYFLVGLLEFWIAQDFGFDQGLDLTAGLQIAFRPRQLLALKLELLHSEIVTRADCRLVLNATKYDWRRSISAGSTLRVALEAIDLSRFGFDDP